MTRQLSQILTRMNLPIFHRASFGRDLALSQVERIFLDLVSGQSISYSDQNGIKFVQHFTRLTTDGIISQCRDVLHPDYWPNELPQHRLLALLCDIIRRYQKEAVSIQRLMQHLSDAGVLCSNADNMAEKQSLFSALGWLSLLYIPVTNMEPATLSIDMQSTKIFSRSSVPIDLAARPLDELFARLGHVLPLNRLSRSATETSVSRRKSFKFRVSSLNAAAIVNIGRIEIKWVDIVGAHLSFDPTGPILYLFRLPSFCTLQQSEDSILPILCRTFLAGDETLDPNFNVPSLMKEIILSYSLLFKQDRAARIMYTKTERQKASIVGPHEGAISVDPVLDRECGFGRSTSILTFGQPVHETYNGDADFPILKGRLLRLDEYMDGIEPNRLQSLWSDRRDLRLWYTVWIVILIGGVSIIQQFVSISISAAQLALARDALDLQRQQTKN